MADDPTTTAVGCTDEHVRFCSDCTTARLYNSIHCQDCGEGRPSAATTEAVTTTAAGRPRKAADSPRWCERCQKYGDHHTDRHDECAPATAAHELPWATVFGPRCDARRERHQDDPYWGRCELIRNHPGDHALERGMDTPRWSTRWTA